MQPSGVPPALATSLPCYGHILQWKLKYPSDIQLCNNVLIFLFQIESQASFTDWILLPGGILFFLSHFQEESLVGSTPLCLQICYGTL